MQDIDLKDHPYRTREGIKEWMKECGFKNYHEAMENLNCGRRQWFRWMEKGLPGGLYGDLVVRVMLDIEQKRKASAGDPVSRSMG